MRAKREFREVGQAEMSGHGAPSSIGRIGAFFMFVLAGPRMMSGGDDVALWIFMVVNVSLMRRDTNWLIMRNGRDVKDVVGRCDGMTWLCHML